MKITQSSFEERLQKLNPEQKKAVETIEGPLLVVAGPGSGKTEILSMRVAEILRKTHAQPSNILCLTFTESAAINMRERLSRLIGDPAYQVSIHTFHNFAVDIIRSHGEFFYHGATFTPADDVLQVSLMESIFTGLSYDNPLRSYHPSEGFVYLKSVLQSISHIKKAGLTPAELRILIDDNELGLSATHQFIVPVLEKRLHKGSGDEIHEMLHNWLAVAADGAQKRRSKIIEEYSKDVTKSSQLSSEQIRSIFSLYKPIEEAMALSLSEVVAVVQESGKNEALTNWKRKWLRKDASNQTILRDQVHAEKLRSVVDIYEKYQEAMYAAGYFDFDDMILDLIKVLSTKPELRYMLLEQYQYVLVDEFQDTNNAQMRILSLITDSLESNGRPNIMVVGDDDQAIYKFQGAELSNILDFKDRYRDVTLVSLVRNYRSTQDILDVAMRVIRKGEKRLENLIPELSKQLIASGDIASGNIEYVALESALHEYAFVSNKIKKLIDGGVEPKEIAVIARKHGQLESLVPHMRKIGIPIKYEREQNVFEEPHIKELITIARYVSSLVSAFDYEKPLDELLPEILSYQFWGIPRVEIWRTSLKANKESKTWMEVMLESPCEKIKQVASFLVDLAGDAPSTPLERMLDRIIGEHIVLEDQGDEESESDNIRMSSDTHKGGVSVFISPFRQFYFSKESLSHARAQYLSFLSSLRVFVQALRDYNGIYVAPNTKTTLDPSDIHDQTDRSLRIVDMIKFVDMYQKNSLQLNDRSPFITARNAVELMSAHGSKGLEYKVVFVLSCQDDVWAGKGRGNKISFPMNIAIEPAGDQEDDQLRLFYVALTRAKEHLYLTSHRIKDTGKPSQHLRFLVDVVSPDTSYTGQDYDELMSPETLETTALQYRTPDFLDEEQILLKSLLETYTLSVTHLNNFINIPKGGPAYFLEQNILRFPQSKSVSGAYGSAVHGALEYVLHSLKDQKVLPNVDDILVHFEVLLKKQKLHPEDFRVMKDRGTQAIKSFILEKGSEFHASDLPEVDFSREHVVLGKVSDADNSEREVVVTGKIDKVAVRDNNQGGLGDQGEIVVHDYKTGKAISSLSDPDAEEALKAYLYKNQLIFYKILIERSSLVKAASRYRDLIGKSVTHGIIDFVEPVQVHRHQSDIHSVDIVITESEVDDMQHLIRAVYKRIISLQFDLPEPILSQYQAGDYTNEVDVVTDFVRFLINEGKSLWCFGGY